MNYQNSITLAGRLGSNATSCGKSAEKPVARLSLATQVNYKVNGQWTSKTSWHLAFAYGDTAKALIDTAKKGQAISIQGSLAYLQNDGKQTAYVEIKSFSFIEETKKNPAPQADAMPVPEATPAATQAVSVPALMDDDIPF